jgi:hypothetical protein
MLRNAGLNMDLNNAAAGGTPVPYLSKEDRQKYEVTVGDDGLLYQKNEDGEPQVMDTSDGTNPNGAYLVGMSRRGSVYAASSQEVQHHSAFFAGDPGAAFGAMKVDQGQWQKVTDRTGHYQTPREYSQQLPAELGDRGADLSALETHYEGLAKADLKRVMPERERLYPQSRLDVLKPASARAETVEAEVPDAQGNSRTLTWQSRMKRY